MKRKVLRSILSLAICAVMVLPASAAYAAEVTPETTAGEETFGEEGADVPVTTAEADANGFVIENGVLTGYTGTAAKIVIPNGVTSIGENAFWENEIITDVTIPDGVTSIGNAAFSFCSSLENITIPNSVTSIGGSAFWGCSSLGNITIPNSVTNIGNYAFMDCSSLKSITIPYGVTSIGYETFFRCSSLENVTIPDSVTSIGSFAFAYCSSLKNIKIPDSVMSIQVQAFDNCSSLESITIPYGVTSIDYGTFCSCISLTSVTIPDSVTRIGEDAFRGCSSLTSLIIPSSVNEIRINTMFSEDGKEATPFEGCDKLTLYGEEGSYVQKFANTYGIPFQVYSNGTADTPGTGSTEDTTSQNIVYLPEGESGISSASMQALVDSNKTRAVAIVNAAGIRFIFAAGSMQMIDGKEVYDFGAEIVKAYSALKNAPFTAAEFVARIDYKYSGKLPGTASVSIPVGKEWAGRMLYYYEIKTDGTYSYVTKGEVDANGNVTVTQDHCSDYVLTTKAPAISPKTGDAVPAALYAAMGLLAVFGVAASIVMLKKGKRRL